MPTCHECGSEVADNDIFCPYCGLSLQKEGVSVQDDASESTDSEGLESTIMMSPAEASRLAAEAVSESRAEEERAAEPIVIEDPVTEPAPIEPDIVETRFESIEVQTSFEQGVQVEGETQDATDEESAAFESDPLAITDVPTPSILSGDTPNTSGSVDIRSTSEYEAADASAFAEPEPNEFEATIIGAPPTGLGPNVEVPERPEPMFEPTGQRVSDIAPSSDNDEAAEEPGAVPEVREGSEPSSLSETVPEAVDPESDQADSDVESRHDETPADSEAGIDAQPEERMISIPDEDLELKDSFGSQSMFDSVRIIENQLPFSQEDVATRVPDSGIGLQRDDSAAARTPQEERPQTTPNIGLTDTDGRRSAKLKPLTEGTILNGRYEIIRKIGGGGMGAVYLASDNNLGGVLRAVKEMVQAHIEEDQQEKAIADFKRESMILSTLDHPSIPTIFDYFYDEEECRFYLVMKYISGGDLASRLRAAPEGKIDEKTVVEWAIQITEVLEYLHNQPTTIVYRDLKPSNIMIDGNSGRVMLIDFGIARSISQKEEKGVTAVGTMGYAPPELFSGNVEPRSDIYSLGSTMFHLLTGADPQSNPLLIFDFQKNPRPRQINPRLSDQIERLLMQSVEYNAEARYSNASELRAVLNEHLDVIRSGQLSFGTGAAPVSVSLSNQQVFCGFCGQRIVATDLFCAFCGAKQPIAQQGVHSEIYSSAPKTARLLIEGTSELTAPTYMLQKEENLVGRRDPMSNIFPEVDLSKYDPQTKISRRHARIWRDGQKFLVEDLGSSNGTVLTPSMKDPFRLAPHIPHALANGDKIKIGDTILNFVVN